MTLDIVIPHYKEPWEIGRTAFEMLSLQRLINFDDIHVYLVQDGEDGALPAELFQHYPYEVTQITIPHSGVSVARNTGMDAGNGDWIMFCDFDDSVFTTHTLFHFLDVAKTQSANLIISEYESEEKDPDGTMWAKVHDGSDYVLLHGRMFRRSWLEKNQVRFDPELTLHEDSYFYMLVRFMMPDKEVVYIREGPLYATYWNRDSVTRQGANAINHHLLLYRYDEFIKKSEHLANELLRRKMIRHAAMVVCQTLCDTYVNFSRISWKNQDTSVLTKYARKFVHEYPELLEILRDSDFLDGIEAARASIRKNHDLGVEKFSFIEWMKVLRSDED